MGDRNNSGTGNGDKTKSHRGLSRAPRAHQSSRVEISPSGVTLRSDGANFLDWHEALSNHLMKEYTPHGQLLKNDEYIVDPGPLRTLEQWDQIRIEMALPNAEIVKMKTKYVEHRSTQRDNMVTDRKAMYGIA